MKRVGIILFLFLFFSFGFKPNENPFRVINKSFGKNEYLEYKVRYGIISAGEAKVEISPEIHLVNSRPCYKVDVNGRTTGAFDLIAKINDVWGAYIDTAALVPHITYRKLAEGGYRKHEIVKFDHSTSFLEAKTYNFKTNEFKEPRYYMFPQNAQDLISGFYFLRSLNFDTIKIRDTISIPAFFEDKLYDFRILYEGKETIDTDFGKIKTLVIKPVMPDNKIFAGENSISCFLSDDSNKIPLKIKADLFIGSAEVELVKAENLRTPFITVK
jgi:hypothetical protein